LRQLWERGRGAWPEIALGFDELEASLRERFAAELEPIADELEAGDLYLACACLLGTPGAAEAFKRSFEPSLRRFVATVEHRPEEIAERVQDMLVLLFVGDGESAPKLASYSGRGPLRSWLRMTAVNRSLNAVRDDRRQAKMESRIVEVMRPEDDPELALLRERYRPQLEAALRDVLASLPRAERGLLRLCYVEGLSLEAIGKIRGLSKATVSRHLAAIRERVLERASRLLRERIGVSGPELESLLGLLQSQLELGLSGLLATIDGTS
jgi:RNA polymerase sigma-70 factor (ECF subfamily)